MSRKGRSSKRLFPTDDTVSGSAKMVKLSQTMQNISNTFGDDYEPQYLEPVDSQQKDSEHGNTEPEDSAPEDFTDIEYLNEILEDGDSIEKKDEISQKIENPLSFGKSSKLNNVSNIMQNKVASDISNIQYELKSLKNEVKAVKKDVKEIKITMHEILDVCVNSLERIKAQSQPKVSSYAMNTVESFFGTEKKPKINSEDDIRKLNKQLENSPDVADNLVSAMIEVYPSLNKTAFQAYFSDKLFIEFGVSGQKTYNLFSDDYADVMKLFKKAYGPGDQWKKIITEQATLARGRLRSQKKS